MVTDLKIMLGDSYNLGIGISNFGFIRYGDWDLFNLGCGIADFGLSGIHHATRNPQLATRNSQSAWRIAYKTLILKFLRNSTR